MEERRSGQDRRSNWVDALIRLRLSDAYLMALADSRVDWIRHGHREGSREALLLLLQDVREQAAGKRTT